MMISLIVAFRNEALCIEDLLVSISNQSVQNFEVIMIDDHSNDVSINLINSFVNKYQGGISFKIIKSRYKGKKKAILQAVDESKGSFLAFTDADCILPNDFIYNYQCKLSQTNGQFFIGAVLFSAISLHPVVLFQEIEQVFIMSIFKFFAQQNIPIGCSGANYGIYKCYFNTDISLDVVSGDDMFQLLKAKENKLNFSFIDVVVKTKPMTSVSSLIQQRLRWSRKMKFVKDKDVNRSMILLFILFLFTFFTYYSLGSLITYTVVFLLFLIADYSITKKVRLLSILSPFLVILYPFYILVLLFLNKTVTLKWKDRDIGLKG